MIILECQNITRKIQNYDGNLWCQKCTLHIKRNQALYKYSSVPTSKQQMYFYNLFKEISITLQRQKKANIVKLEIIIYNHKYYSQQQINSYLNKNNI